MEQETVAIIPCTNQKAEVAGTPREIWTGTHFQLVLAHAEMFYDRVMVMSYKYGFIDMDFMVEPYDFDVRTASVSEKLKWWFKVRQDIHDLADAKPLLIALYTGDFERERIIREFQRCGMNQIILPFEGLGIGQRQQAVYDCVEPYNREKAEAHAYDLPPLNEVSPKEALKGQGTKYLPPPTQFTDEIMWE